MAFFYQYNCDGNFQCASSGWTFIEHGRHRLLFHDSQDSTFAELPADDLISDARGRAWLVIEGFPAVAAPESSVPDAHAFARSLLTGNDQTDRWRGIFVGLLIVPEEDLAICWRDPVGGRTAFYRVGDSSFDISSSAHALAVSTGNTEDQPGFIASLFALRGDRPPGRSAFRAVDELLPGERLEANGARVRLARRPISLPPAFNGPPEDRIDQLDRCFRAAVRRTLPADGPVGVMLSGGLDSGPTAAVAASLLQQSGRKLHAISWRLPDFPDCDESRWIRDVAAHSRIPLHDLDGSACTPFSILDSSASNPDYPSYNAFRHLFNSCYGKARELGLSVLLNAHAADDLYPPYNYILVDLFRRRRLAHFGGRLIREIGRSPTRIHRNRALRGLAAYLLGRHRRAPQAPPWMTPIAASELLKQDFHSWLPEAAGHAVPAYCRKVLGLGVSGGVQYEITMSGRYGVSRRDPFYDLDLLKFFLETPPWMAASRPREKWMMREAMNGKLPESVRIKGRTGLLHAFFREGFRRHLPSIRERLMDAPEWSRWVRREFVEKALCRNSSERQMMVITACLGYVLWRERIRENPFS